METIFIETLKGQVRPVSLEGFEVYPISKEELNNIADTLEQYITDLNISLTTVQPLSNFIRNNSSSLANFAKLVTDLKDNKRRALTKNAIYSVIPQEYLPIVIKQYSDIINLLVNRCRSIIGDVAKAECYKQNFESYFENNYRYFQEHEPTLASLFSDYLNTNYDNILKKDTELPSVNDIEHVKLLPNGDIELNIWVQLFKGRRQGWWSTESYIIKDGAKIYKRELTKYNARKEKYLEEKKVNVYNELKSSLYDKYARMYGAGQVLQAIEELHTAIIPLIRVYNRLNGKSFFGGASPYLKMFNETMQYLVFLNTNRHKDEYKGLTDMDMYKYNKIADILNPHNSFNKYKYSNAIKEHGTKDDKKELLKLENTLNVYNWAA